MHYFAYGSNLNKGQMQHRCPDAKPVGALMLPKARLIFKNVADVEYHETETAAGGLWTISASDEKTLDRYEGVHHGLYVKQYIRVQVRDREHDTLIYTMGRGSYGMPSQGYYDTIRRGYDDFGIKQGMLVKALRDTRLEVEGGS
jgi:hypothetical protein